MTAFLDDITPFYGNKERNAEGQTLEEFLEAYDPQKYEQPSVTVDVMVVCHPRNITSLSDGLKVLMIQRGNHPSIGKWALPGGFVNMKEDAVDSAKRELREETGLSNIPLEQLRTWGEWERDPRSRVITIAYLALIGQELHPKAGDDADDAIFFDIKYLPISEEKIDGKIKSIFEIMLTNKERDVTLCAKLCETSNEMGLLKEKKLEILENDGFACDHARIIADGFLHIQSLILEKR